MGMEQSNYATNNRRIAMRVSVLSIIVNIILSLSKFVAGIVAQSGAMLSDAVHSASDVFSTFIVMIGISLSGKKSDKEHPYGHDRLECVASIVLSVILFATGLGIGFNGIEKIASKDYTSLSIPGRLALFTAIGSIITKEWMYWYTRSAAKRIHSDALMADAWHHRSDSLSSIGSFLGILAARLGFPVFDPVASVIICLFILKAAISIFRDSIDKMVDKSCDDTLVEQMKQIVLQVSGVDHIDEIRTRMFGAMIYVDIEIAADGTLTLNAAHSIAESVHSTIEEHFPLVKHCMVHVNPVKK